MDMRARSAFGQIEKLPIAKYILLSEQRENVKRDRVSIQSETARKNSEMQKS